MANIVLIGRPNVGKSALFNSIIRRNKAIVHHYCGVTRDSVSEEINAGGYNLVFTDCAGLDNNTSGEIEIDVQKKLHKYIDSADIILFVVDGQVGLTSLDMEVAKAIRKTSKPIIMAVNKCDTERLKMQLIEFSVFGFDSCLDVSATTSRRIYDLLEVIVDKVKDIEDKSNQEIGGKIFDKIAIVGRPNTGKSSLTNKLIKDEKCVVSSIPGTTRDSNDISVKISGRNYVFIDTAGIRNIRSRKMEGMLESLGIQRTKKSIDFADIVLVVIDAVDGICTTDKKILKLVADSKKPAIIIVNKWDLVNIRSYSKVDNYINTTFTFLKRYPKLYVSANTGKNVSQILALVNGISKKIRKKIPTSTINKLISDIVSSHQPPVLHGKRLKVYYVTQISSAPMEFVLFVNRVDLAGSSYIKYLESKIIEKFDLNGIPVTIKLKGKPKKEDKV